MGATVNNEQRKKRVKTHTGIFDGLRGLSLEMTLDEARGAAHQGQCDEDCKALAAQPHIAKQLDAFPVDTIRAGLNESGAWDAEELADDDQNRIRAVWFAACDIVESLSDTTPAPMSNRETFKAAYIKALGEAVAERPDLYAWADKSTAMIDHVAGKMFEAMERGTFNHDSLAYRKTAKALGIKPTRKAIIAFWKGEPI